MKIIFVSKQYFPHIGGVEKHIFEVSRSLKLRKHNVGIICEQVKETPAEEILNGVKIHRISYPKRKFIGLFSIWWWVVKNRNVFAQADIIHAHDVFIWLLPLKILLPKKPLYATFHGWEGIYPIPWKNKFIRRLSAKLIKGNICVGEYVEKWYGIKADYIVYGGAKISNESKYKYKYKKNEAPRPASRDVVSSPLSVERNPPKQNVRIHPRPKNVPWYSAKEDKQLRILYLGRLDKDTGLKKYLQALQLIKAKYKNAKIGFLGDGALRSDCEDLGKVHGFQKDITPFLAKTRFVLTSGYLSMVEAMQAKKLVFPTYTNSLKADIIWLSPFNDLTVHFSFPETLLKKIEFFLDNPDQEEKIVNKAYVWAKDQTWSNIVKTYLKLWGQW